MRLDSIRRKVEQQDPAAIEAAQREEVRRAHALACNLHLGELLKQLGPRFHPDRVSLENYEATGEGQQWVMRRVRALAERLPASIREGESLVLYGTPGTGKDHLLASLLHLAAGKHGISAGWTSGARLYARFRDLIRAARGEGNETALVDSFARWGVLGISDPIPPADDPSSWAVNQLHAVIDARYAALRPTWFTVNVLKKDDLKEKLTVQLYERLADQGLVLPCFWPSYRTPRESP
jgi:DNA replication protein DnaC